MKNATLIEVLQSRETLHRIKIAGYPTELQFDRIDDVLIESFSFDDVLAALNDEGFTVLHYEREGIEQGCTFDKISYRATDDSPLTPGAEASEYKTTVKKIL